MTDFTGKEPGDLLAVDQSSLLGCQKALLHQILHFLGDLLRAAAVFIAQILQGQVDGTAVGLARKLPRIKPGTPPGTYQCLWLLGILSSLHVLDPSLSAGGGLLGWRLGCLQMTIAEGQRVAQGFFCLRRHGLAFFPALICPHGFLRNLSNTDFPGDIPRLCFPGPSAQGVQFSRLRPAQCRKQHPVPHTDGIPAKQFPAVKVHSQGNILQIRCQGLGRIGHNQTIFGPGHGNIKHPHFLGNAFRLHFRGNCPLGDGGIPKPVGIVRHGKAQSQLFVAQDLRSEALLVKLSGQITQKHHRKFQALGFVDAHNLDTARSGGIRRYQSPLLHSIQMLQELG